MNDPIKPETLHLGEVVDKITSFAKHYFSQKKLILICISACLSLAILFYFIQKSRFTAETNFVLMESGSSKGGALSSIGSQFGIDLGGMSGQNSLFSGDNILDIIKSRNIVEKVLLTSLDSSDKKSTTLADLYLKYHNASVGININKERYSQINFVLYKESSQNKRLNDSVLFLIYKDIIKNTLDVEHLNKKGTIIKLTATSLDEEFSKIFTERLLTEAKNLYITIKTTTNQENVNRLQARADSLYAIFHNQSFEFATLQVVDENAAFTQTKVPVELKQKDINIAMTVYTEVIKNLELAKMSLSQQTPVIQVIDMPKYPLPDSKIKFKILIAIGLFAGIFTSFILSLFKPQD